MKTTQMKWTSLLVLAVTVLVVGSGCTLSDILFGTTTETCLVNNVVVDCSTLAQ